MNSNKNYKAYAEDGLLIYRQKFDGTIIKQRKRLPSKYYDQDPPTFRKQVQDIYFKGGMIKAIKFIREEMNYCRLRTAKDIFDNLRGKRTTEWRYY